jgi:hypothetical protein
MLFSGSLLGLPSGGLAPADRTSLPGAFPHSMTFVGDRDLFTEKAIF